MRPAIVWFRDDLRLGDNPALAAALRTGRPLHCVYVLDDETPRHRRMGAAARWWLHHSLAALQAALRERGGRLTLRAGPAGTVVPALAREAEAGAVFWNRRYAPADTATDAAIKDELRHGGAEVESFNGALLNEPWDVRSGSGEAFKVFSPFWRAVLAKGEPRAPFPTPETVPSAPKIPSDDLAAWRLTPSKPDWSGGMAKAWTPGRAGAEARLAEFLDGGLAGYAQNRDRPDMDSSSRLSPHLRFGELSPVEVWHAARHTSGHGHASERDIEKFLAEVGWREFSYHLLHTAEDLSHVNIQRRFDAFPWRRDRTATEAWRRGLTGYPLVDAGMRQLWETGWMHNRVRMVVASFFIKHLLLDWREGEAWFWDTLVDADPANNPASWQWVAGSGADAAPYFRIFNPVTQGEKFDPDGAFVRRYVPELAQMPADAIHRPWLASREVLERAGVRLGDTYPEPMVDHASARERALAALDTIKSAA